MRLPAQRRDRRPRLGLGQRARGLDVAGGETCGGLAEPASRQLFRSFARRQPCGRGQEIGGGLRCAAPSGPRRGALDLGGDVLVRACRAEREVARTLLGIDDHRRETLVQPAPPLACCGSVDDRREQRVREPDPVALGDQHARVLRLDHGGARVALPVERLHDRGDRRLRERSGRERDDARVGREGRDPCRHQVLDAPRHRQRLVPAFVAPERARDLEREERVAAGSVREPDEQRPRQGRPEPAADQVVQRRHRERSDDDPLTTVVRQRTREPERQVGVSFDPPRHEQREPGRQPPRREREGLLRRRVEPLDVVDRQQHGAPRRERVQDGDQRGRGRSRVRRLVRLSEQERRFERAPLQRRQLALRLLERGADEVGDRRVRELRLALRRARLQHAETARIGSPHRLEPERRLADPRLAVEDERGRTFGRAVEEAPGCGELLLAADDRGLHATSRALGRIARRPAVTCTIVTRRHKRRETPDAAAASGSYRRRMARRPSAPSVLFPDRAGEIVGDMPDTLRVHNRRDARPEGRFATRRAPRERARS